jgi:hypothetical protein
MADTLPIKFDFQAAQALADIEKSKKSLKDLADQWEKASDAERKAAKDATKLTAWKVLTADLGKLGETIDGTHPRLMRLAQGAANVAQGVAGAIGALAGMGAALVATLAHAEQQEAAIRRLGDAYGTVTQQTNGVMSAQEALALQGQIQAAGVRVNAEQLGLLARAAREYALATGNDASQAVEKLTNAIVNNSEDALSELNLSQARATSSAQTLANMTNTLRQRFEGTVPTARTLTEDLKKLPDVIAAIGASAADAAAGGLRQLIDALMGSGTAARLWRDLVESRDTQQTLAAQGRSNDAMERRRQQRERSSALFRDGNVRLNETNAANFGNLEGLTEQERARVNRAATPGMWAGSSASESVNLELAAINDERFQRQVADAQRAGDTMSAKDEDALRSRKFGQQLARAGESAEQLAARLDKAKEIASGGFSEFGEALTRISQLIGAGAARTNLQSMRSVLGLQSLSDEESAELFGGIADAQIGGGLSQREESARQQRRLARDRETRREALATGGGVGGAVRRGLGVTGDAMETEAKLTQGYADTIVGAYGKIGDAITRHVELVASGQETIGQAVLNGVHEVTKALAMEALPKSLMELAAGFAALANPLTAATAPLHFTAAGVYGAVAAGAGLVAGVTGALGAGATPPGASGAAATGAARAASGRSTPPPNESAAPVTIYLSSIVPPGPRELQPLIDAGAQAGRYGLDRRHGLSPRTVRA